MMRTIAAGICALVIFASGLLLGAQVTGHVHREAVRTTLQSGVLCAEWMVSGIDKVWVLKCKEFPR